MSANRLFWGILVVFIGLLWLLANLGILPSSIWYDAWMFWPIFIILWGISILFSKSGGRSYWVPIIAVLTIAVAVFVYSYNFKGERTVIHNKIISEQLLETAESAHLEFVLGAMDFSLSGGGDILLEGEAETITGVEVSNNLSNGVQRIKVGQLPFGGLKIGANFQNSINLRTINNLPLQVEIDSGASKMDLDLKEAMLKSLDIDSGATSATIALGDKMSEVNINISSGASSFDVNIPGGFAIKIINKSGLSGNNFSAIGLVKSGENWLSSDYNQNDNKINILFESGVSNINISRY